MGFFKNIGNKIADTAKGIKTKIDSKIQEHKENKEQQKILNEKFKAEKNALVFTVYFRNGKKQSFTGLLNHGDHIIRLDSDLKSNEVTKISDEKNNEYYIIRINPIKYQYQVTIPETEESNIVLTKELDEIEYTNEKPKEEKTPVINTYNITNTDNSTTIKGVKNSNVNSTDSKVDSKKEVSVGVDISANLQQKKGE